MESRGPRVFFVAHMKKTTRWFLLASGRGSYLQSNGTFFAAARLETGPGPESVDGDGACVFSYLWWCKVGPKNQLYKCKEGLLLLIDQVELASDLQGGPLPVLSIGL